MKILIDKNADINKDDKYKNIPLIISCYLLNEELISYLVDHGTEVNIKNMYNDLPLSIIRYFRNDDILNV